MKRLLLGANSAPKQPNATKDAWICLGLAIVLTACALMAVKTSSLLAAVANQVGVTFPVQLAGSIFGLAVALKILYRLNITYRSPQKKLDVLHETLKKGKLQKVGDSLAGPKGLSEIVIAEALDTHEVILTREEVPSILESIAIRCSAPLTAGENILDWLIESIPLVGLLGTLEGLASGMRYVNGSSGVLSRLAGSIGHSLFSTIMATIIVLSLYLLRKVIQSRLKSIEAEVGETVALLEANFTRQFFRREAFHKPPENPTETPKHPWRSAPTQDGEAHTPIERSSESAEEGNGNSSCPLKEEEAFGQNPSPHPFITTPQIQHAIPSNEESSKDDLVSSLRTVRTHRREGGEW